MPAKSPAEPGEVRKLTSEASLQRELNRGEKALSEAAALLVLQKKYQALSMIDEAVATGARAARACQILDLSLRAVQCWKGTPYCAD